MPLVFITGSALRIGSYIAIHFASKGWDVAIHCNNSFQEAEKLKIDIKHKYKVNVEVFKFDLFNLQNLQNLILEVNNSIGKIDCLINNAAVFFNDTFESFSIENWERHHKINVLAPILLSKAFFLQSEKTSHANIINITDSDIFGVHKTFISYLLSKEALDSLTKKMALEFAPNIRVNSIALGNILKGPKETEKHFADAISNSPLQIAPPIEEVCNTVFFFINSLSVTGQTIILDSGKHLLTKYN